MMARSVIRVVICAFVIGASLNSLAAPPPPSAVKEGKLMDRIAANSGGYVFRETPGKVLRIVNAAQVDEKLVLRKVADLIEEKIRTRVEISLGSFESCRFRDEKSVGAWVFVEKDTSNPALLVAPEETWCRINISRLRDDDPANALFISRIQKEVLRGSSMVMGCYCSDMQPSALRGIKTLKMLDVAPLSITPDSLNLMLSFAKDNGYSRVKKMTYRHACREGWAPAPTNDIQRVIWEEYHTAPTEPIHIEFDPKKGM